MSHSQPASAHPPTILFREHVTPPVWWWIVAAALSCMTVGAVYPVWKLGAFIIPPLVFGLIVLWLLTVSPKIGITTTEFFAGPAHISRSYIASAIALNREETFLECGANLDARAFLVIRPWSRSAVKVILNDPDDPTPYWLISSKRAEAIAAILNASEES